ncbi:hypothetical protein JCM3774_005578, partial [Rhodotorula dairenensis]
MPPSGRGYRHHGTKRPRGSVATSNKPQQPPPAAAPGPLRDWSLLERSYPKQLVQPGSKYLENPKGVLANYVKALGFDPDYSAHRVSVDGQVVYRVSVLADPDPPPPVQRSLGYNSASSSGPPLPPIAQPVVGHGDAPTVKEAEKLAAIDACLQLAHRGLFNK